VPRGEFLEQLGRFLCRRAGRQHGEGRLALSPAAGPGLGI
jgi:hypothetical protein